MPLSYVTIHHLPKPHVCGSFFYLELPDLDFRMLATWNEENDPDFRGRGKKGGANVHGQAGGLVNNSLKKGDASCSDRNSRSF
jgi:hypothetical protein